MSETLILVATFFGVLIFATAVSVLVARRREVSARVDDASGAGSPAADNFQSFIDGRLSKRHAVYISHYYNVTRADENKDSIANRVIRAGFFSPNASAIFQILRTIAALATAVGANFLFEYVFVRVSAPVALTASLLSGGLMFMLANVILERMGVAKERAYRRLFPDFMDMLIICVDAGLSIEAAISRVAREFLNTHPDFGLHLTVMTLEIRGGRRVREALSNLAKRLQIDEAQSLAVLFRQSEELGTSVTKSLRVYSKEMRQMRILRAEEKANALPIKMLFPLATFLFPLSILIVLVPIVLRVVSILKGLAVG